MRGTTSAIRPHSLTVQAAGRTTQLTRPLEPQELPQRDHSQKDPRRLPLRKDRLCIHLDVSFVSHFCEFAVGEGHEITRFRVKGP